ncbi:MAG: substrate-binding domain-containing protein [Kiritimatiellae bacterium]|nr:substrate-binding domain-containing protein [Kiritimatiellia bacterium]
MNIGGKTVLMFLPKDHFRAQEGLNAVRAEASPRHWHFFSAEIAREPDGSPVLARATRSAASVSELFRALRPDGVVVWRWALAPDEVRAAAGRDIPMVFVHRPFDFDAPDDPGVAYVLWDSASIATFAARTLLFSGYGDFAYVPWCADVPWSRERQVVFRRAVEAAGKRFHEFAQPLAKWLATLPKPCGVFAANDNTGEAILSACVEAGLHVPDDIAVVGVGDVAHVCEATRPTLSSVALDRRVEGRAAAELLDGWMRRRGKPCPAPPSVKIPARGVALRASSRFARDRRVVAALEFIRLRACDEDFAPPAVARHMGVSRTMADRLFRTVLGRTILDEIHDIRLARAKELLHDGRPPDFVAAECGYSSHDVFRHVFRDRVGQTVRKWVLENR